MLTGINVLSEGVYIMLMYKIDVLSELLDKGYSSYRLRKEKLLSEKTIQKLRHDEPLSWNELDMICELLNCQPGKILEHY